MCVWVMGHMREWVVLRCCLGASHMDSDATKWLDYWGLYGVWQRVLAVHSWLHSTWEETGRPTVTKVLHMTGEKRVGWCWPFDSGHWLPWLVTRWGCSESSRV